jgi:hypothetical protein
VEAENVWRKIMSFENYKVTLFRPEGVSVSQMDTYIRKAILSGVFTVAAGIEMLEMREHPVKVSLENAHHCRKEAIF